jgi:hypothetical protein
LQTSSKLDSFHSAAQGHEEVFTVLASKFGVPFFAHSKNSRREFPGAAPSSRAII